MPDDSYQELKNRFLWSTLPDLVRSALLRAFEVGRPQKQHWTTLRETDDYQFARSASFRSLQIIGWLMILTDAAGLVLMRGAISPSLKVFGALPVAAVCLCGLGVLAADWGTRTSDSALECMMNPFIALDSLEKGATLGPAHGLHLWRYGCHALPQSVGPS